MKYFTERDFFLFGGEGEILRLRKWNSRWPWYSVFVIFLADYIHVRGQINKKLISEKHTSNTGGLIAHNNVLCIIIAVPHLMAVGAITKGVDLSKILRGSEHTPPPGAVVAFS